MKRKTILVALVLVVMVVLLFGKAAYALTTHQVIYVTVIIEPSLSMDLDDESLERNLKRPEAEAFSELKEQGIQVEKLQKEGSALWRFTKTE